MTKRTVLTDKAIKALKPTDKTYEISDALVPGMLLRVQPTGAKSFNLIARYPGSRNPTRRSLGTCGAISLADAREKARRWLALLEQGKDPAEEVQKAKAEADRKRKDTIASLAETYITTQVVGPDPKNPKMRCAERYEHELRNVLIPMFGHRPIAELTSQEVSTAMREIEALGTDHALVKLGVRKELVRPSRAPKPAPQMARELFVHLDLLLAWAADTGDYGIDISPLKRIKKGKRFAARPTRDHNLSREYIGAVWRASGTLRTPYRQLYRILLLTGLRLSEVREASWNEFELKAKEWTIPAARMKGKNGRAQPHTVPLTKLMLEVLKEVPVGTRGEFVFSIDGGAKPVSSGGNFKKHLDAAMVADLGIPDSQLEHFCNHDLRRSMRTQLSKLGISHDVCEAMLAHRRPGVWGTYDQDDRFDARHNAHVQWGDLILDCADRKPPKGNVVTMRRAAA
jgi:integrase